MRILFFGDVVGERAVNQLAQDIPQWRKVHQVDLVIANVENAVVSRPEDVRRGFGLNLDTVKILTAAGVDVLTGGNHSWDAPDPETVMSHPQVVRPHNVVDTLPGKGYLSLDIQGQSVVVLNLMGAHAAAHRYTVTNPLLSFEDCQFPEDSLVIVDFHTSTPLEKQAFAYAVDGRVGAVLGTHTHEPSLPLHRLPQGTFLVTDVGMNGPSGGVVGVGPDYFIQKMHNADAPVSFTLAQGPLQLGAVLLDMVAGTMTRLSSPHWLSYAEA